eukprot:3234490-Pleurochrysis_carterae.AAC.7
MALGSALGVRGFSGGKLSKQEHLLLVDLVLFSGELLESEERSACCCGQGLGDFFARVSGITHVAFVAGISSRRLWQAGTGAERAVRVRVALAAGVLCRRVHRRTAWGLTEAAWGFGVGGGDGGDGGGSYDGGRPFFVA